MVDPSSFMDANRGLYHQRVRFIKYSADRPVVQEYVVTLPLGQVKIRDVRTRLCHMTKTAPTDLRLTIVESGHFTNSKLDDKDDLLRLPLLDHEITLYAYDLPKPKMAADGTAWDVCPVYQRLRLEEKDGKHNNSNANPYIYGIPTFVHLKIGLITNPTLLDACRQAIHPFIQQSLHTPPDINVSLVTPNGNSLLCPGVERHEFLLTQYSGATSNRWALCVQWSHAHQYNPKIETPILTESIQRAPDCVDTTCIVCLARPRSKIFLPCGHFCYCDICLEEARRTSVTPERPVFTCCICRTPITTVQKVHFA